MQMPGPAPKLQGGMWHSTPGGVRPQSRGKARLYEAAVPSYLAHSSGNYLGEVVRYRGEAMQMWRKRALGESKLVSSHLQPGKEVDVRGYGPGILLYLGPVKGFKGARAGIALIEPIDGAGNGCCHGVRYFTCPDGHAVFVDTTDVSQLWRDGCHGCAPSTDGAGKWDGKCYVYPGANVYSRHSFAQEDHVRQLEKDRKAKENRKTEVQKLRKRLAQQETHRNDTNSKFQDRYGAKQSKRLAKVQAKDDYIKHVRNDRVGVYLTAHYPSYLPSPTQAGKAIATPTTAYGDGEGDTSQPPTVELEKLQELRRVLGASRPQPLLNSPMPAPRPDAHLPPILSRLRGPGGPGAGAANWVGNWAEGAPPPPDIREVYPVYQYAEAACDPQHAMAYGMGIRPQAQQPRPARLSPIGHPNPVSQGYTHHVPVAIQPKGDPARDAALPFDTRTVTRVTDAHYAEGPHLQRVRQQRGPEQPAPLPQHTTPFGAPVVPGMPQRKGKGKGKGGKVTPLPQPAATPPPLRSELPPFTAPAPLPAESPYGPGGGAFDPGLYSVPQVAPAGAPPPVGQAYAVPSPTATAPSALSPGCTRGVHRPPAQMKVVTARPEGGSEREVDDDQQVVPEATPTPAAVRPQQERVPSIFDTHGPMQQLLALERGEEQERTALQMEELCLLKCHIEKNAVAGDAPIAPALREALADVEDEEAMARQTYTLEEQCGFGGLEAAWTRREEVS
eukprot:TRINITY_DN24691_c0_g1_i1.p1 TRINITY_DN24691_c0_g1~~TRINITY_DN24691_c0_g1_i1.p1  ORF type:complete len:743 (+),score=168.42 TRINITY_DN24691_c0_g1_i1:47-2230(+)